jgi:alpha-L-fucosidase
MASTKWFTEARFGLFIHWGLYAIPAKGEWYMSQAQLPFENGYKRYFEEFDPKNCDIKEWIRLAKKAGMKYAVMTAKHHDGFCLFDSALTEYKSTNTKQKRDFIAEFVEACRAEDIKVGIYYSLLDWVHEDYPKFNDRFHPMRGNEKYKDEVINWENYVDYMHGQIRELCTNYGKIDIMWFDFSYDEMCAGKWKGEELLKMVRTLQPEILVDNRLEAAGSSNGSILENIPSPYAGDFASPEQYMPTREICKKNGESIPWELCTTMNDSWGYNAYDNNYKTSDFIILKLVECVSKSGNLIVNIGPDANGEIPYPQQKILSEIGEWMDKNQESIYDCGKSKFERPDWGRYTQNKNVVYAHITEGTIGPLPLTGIPRESIQNVRILENGSEPYDASLAMGAKKELDKYFINFTPNINGTPNFKGACDVVLKIILKEDEEITNEV